jgi:hypothetical protein
MNINKSIIYKKILKESFNKGFITKKVYKKELNWINKFNKTI